MDDVPNDEPRPSLPGGTGWGVRQPAPRPRDPWADTLATPPPVLPPVGPPAASAPPGFSAVSSASPVAPRRGLALIGGAAAVAAALVVAVAVMASHKSAPASTDAAAVATAAATAAPTATPAPTAISAAAIRAGQEYLAAVTPLNTALNRFSAAYNAAMHSACSCPTGQFDASAALKQLPGVSTDIESLQVTLQHIKVEVPSLSADIDAVVSDNQQAWMDVGNASHGYVYNDPAAITDSLNALAADQQRATPDVQRLRADLGLPPPAS